ncbi:DUF6192 family protein [Streptomyces venezuelae]|uniref:DUF6192 family protein n=1 Tax=Streptomyces venezuelae TaxID=54571 RepID=UPI003788EC14
MREAQEDEVTGDSEPPLAPTVRKITHAIAVLDLVPSCHVFVAETSRVARI